MSAIPNRRSKHVLIVALALGGVTLPGAEPEARTATLKYAAALIERRDLVAAEEPLRGLLKQEPSDAVALNLLGLIRVQQQRFTEAEALFSRAVQTGRGIAGPHINLARMYAADRPLNAIDQLRSALQVAPGNPQAQTLLRSIAKDSALTASRAGNYQEGFDIVAKAQAVLPRDPELLCDEGLLALETRDYKHSAESFERALKADPKFAEARYGLARAYLEQNMAARAEFQMRRYLESRSTDASAHYGLGYILMAEQQPEAARAEFERSMQLRPEQTESLFQLGEIALEQDNKVAAKADFAKVLTRDPHHAGALTGLGILCYRASALEEALSYCEEAIGAAPDYQKAHYFHALTLARLGRKTDAEHEFEVARTLQKPHMSNSVLIERQ